MTEEFTTAKVSIKLSLDVLSLVDWFSEEPTPQEIADMFLAAVIASERIGMNIESQVGIVSTANTYLEQLEADID